MISSVGSTSDYWQMMAAQNEKKSLFEETDATSDGSLDLEELTAFAEKVSEMTGRTVSAEDLMDNLDSDGDGQVSEEEFQAAMPPPPPGPPPETQGTGENQGADINALLEALTGSEDDEESSVSIDAMDTNGDGTVDADELAAGLSKIFQEYANQAGNFGSQENGTQSQLSVQV